MGVNEAVKYRPDNISPLEFMRPPTEPLERDLLRVALRLQGRINKVALRIADRYGMPTSFEAPRLQVGAELELLLFSNQFDPLQHSRYNSLNNPNYSPAHLAASKRLIHDMTTSGGIADVLQSHEAVNIDRLFAEIRTRPASVREYIRQMKTIRAYMQRHSTNILPVLHSQHIHMSVTNASDTANILARPEIMALAQFGILDTYQRAYGLLSLPEEVANPKYTSLDTDSAIRENGRGTRGGQGPTRLEGRINSSEYIFDPYLNLTLQLIGLCRGLESFDHPQRVKGGSKITVTPRSYGDRVVFENGMHRSYTALAEQVLDDPVLQEYLPKTVREALYKRMMVYSDVSYGDRKVSEIREGKDLPLVPGIRRRKFARFLRRFSTFYF